MSHEEDFQNYVHDFKAPEKTDISKALGKIDDHDSINFIFNDDFFETFDSLSLPRKESDWLAQYAEKGQTYMEYIQLSKTLHTPASSHRKTIYLTLFGSVDSTILDVDSLVDYTRRFFQMQVKLINLFNHVQWNDEKNQWTCTMTVTNGKNRCFNLRTRYDEKTKHSQIRVTGILNLLKKVVPDDARCLIALSMYDLYDSEEDLFIAGLAMGNNRVAAFSLCRYDPLLTFDEFNWFDCKLKATNNSEDKVIQRQVLLLLRACRLLTHEICHLLGIAHCIFYSCLLNGSGNLEEDFRQPLLECPIDMRKLYSVIHFDVSTRYEELLTFFKTHHCLDECKMVETKLNVIKSLSKSNSSISNVSKRTNLKTEDVSKTTAKRFKRR